MRYRQHDEHDDGREDDHGQNELNYFLTTAAFLPLHGTTDLSNAFPKAPDDLSRTIRWLRRLSSGSAGRPSQCAILPYLNGPKVAPHHFCGVVFILAE